MFLRSHAARTRDGSSVSANRPRRLSFLPLAASAVATGSLLAYGLRRRPVDWLRMDSLAKRVRPLLDYARVVLWDWDVRKDRLECVGNLAALSGVRQLSNWASWIALIHPDDRDAHRREVEAVLAHGRGFRMDVRLRRPDTGEEVWVDVCGRVVRRRGVAVGMTGLAADITVRHQAEVALREARDVAESAQQAKTDFMVAISHDLRTPLNAIVGYADLLRVEAGGNERIVQYADRISAAAFSQLAMVDEVLTFTRLGAGKEVAEIESFETDTLIRQLATEIDPLAAKKGLALEVEVGELPHTIRSDALKLKRILVNLLENAIKFTESGAVRLRAGVRARQLVFEVEDSGIGISDEDAKMLFEPFWQVVRGAERGRHGAGLGLTIAKRYAELLGGELGFISEPGLGTTFRLSLPL